MFCKTKKILLSSWRALLYSSLQVAKSQTPEPSTKHIPTGIVEWTEQPLTIQILLAMNLK